MHVVEQSDLKSFNTNIVYYIHINIVCINTRHPITLPFFIVLIVAFYSMSLSPKSVNITK